MQDFPFVTSTSDEIYSRRSAAGAAPTWIKDLPDFDENMLQTLQHVGLFRIYRFCSIEYENHPKNTWIFTQLLCTYRCRGICWSFVGSNLDFFVSSQDALLHVKRTADCRGNSARQFPFPLCLQSTLLSRSQSRWSNSRVPTKGCFGQFWICTWLGPLLHLGFLPKSLQLGLCNVNHGNHCTGLCQKVMLHLSFLKGPLQYVHHLIYYTTLPKKWLVL